MRSGRNKYGAKACAHDGQAFRSQLERFVYGTLLLMERAGEINSIRREQSVQLTPSIKHKIDFLVKDARTGEEYGIEAKGAETEAFGIKRRLYDDFGPIRAEVWKGRNGRVGVAYTMGPGKYKWSKNGSE